MIVTVFHKSSTDSTHLQTRQYLKIKHLHVCEHTKNNGQGTKNVPMAKIYYLDKI